MNKLLASILDAHGGMDRWNGYDKVEATIVKVLVARAHEKFDQAGTLIDQATRGFLARFLEAFSEWVAHFSRH